jgi:hypothetical protein
MEALNFWRSLWWPPIPTFKYALMFLAWAQQQAASFSEELYISYNFVTYSAPLGMWFVCPAIASSVTKTSATCAPSPAATNVVSCSRKSWSLSRSLAPTPCMGAPSRRNTLREQITISRADVHRASALNLTVTLPAQPQSSWTISPTRTTARQLSLITDGVSTCRFKKDCTFSTQGRVPTCSW